MLTILSFKNFL